MKHIFTTGLLALACFALTAGAQDWYHDRMARWQGEQWHQHLFEHVRMDLEHVQATAFGTSQKEHRRLERTKEELGDLQVKLSQHRFDDHELSDVMDSLVKSSNDQRLQPRDREILNDDLNRLREFRAHHDQWWR